MSNASQFLKKYELHFFLENVLHFPIKINEICIGVITTRFKQHHGYYELVRQAKRYALKFERYMVKGNIYTKSNL